jgi:hypothetical protein
LLKVNQLALQHLQTKPHALNSRRRAAASRQTVHAELWPRLAAPPGLRLWQGGALP